MKNKDYWANRAKILEKSLLDKSYDYTKNLEKQFDIAIKDVEKDMASWYQKFADNNGITLAEAQKLLKAGELKEFKWTVDEYIKYGQENALSQKWIKQLKNASARVHITRLESLKIQLQQQAEALHGAQNQELGQRLGELYSQGYYHTAFEIQRGLGVGWTIQGIDHEQIKKVLSRPWTLDSQTFSDRIWKNKSALIDNVTTSLTQMIMRGDSPDKAIKTIADKFGVSKRQAGRLVMTESAAFANEARKDCFNDLGVEKFVISETLDKETCPLCGQLDGKVFPMKEYAVGITAPPFHPWCRGTTAPWFEDMQELIDRAARDNDGKTYSVPGNMKYEDWAKKYINSPGTSKKGFTNGGKSGIISSEELKKNFEEMFKNGGSSQDDSLEKKFADLVDNQTGFTDDFKKSLKDAFANGTPAAQKAYIKFATSDMVASTTNAKNCFKPGEDKIYLNVNSLINDRRGPATSFYHEFGHLVDFRARGTGVRVSIDNPAFVKAIHKDFDDLIQDYMKTNKCKKADAYSHFFDEFSKNPPAVNQISDLFGGLAKKRDRRLYGHDVSYWNDQSLSKEAFAHLFECQFDSARRDLMQQYFPTALAEFEKMLGGLV